MNPAEPQFIVDVDHNPYLTEGAGTVDAIVSIAPTAEQTDDAATFERLEAIIIDCSASMKSPAGKFDAAKGATLAAVAELRDGTYFAIIAGTETSAMVYPQDGVPVPASAASRAAATRAVEALRPQGGTAMGTWLAHVREVASRHPGALAHAILLTDGKNEHEEPEQLRAEVARSEGRFTCDCRGVGTDWEVAELRAIASALLGTVDIVAEPADLPADFAAMMQTSMSKTIPELTLRLWMPVGARVAFVKQVAPTVEDLTHRRVDVDAQTGGYPLGAWGAEERDYHIQVQVEPGQVGQKRLAARVTVLAGAEKVGEGLVPVTWTDDASLSAKISRRVAHYTGQAEYAEAVQAGLEARRDGDDAKALAELGRAMQIAKDSGNAEQTSLLRKVIDVDERTGTARLRREVSAADEMALDARSTRTARVRKGA
ncbi:VWA domain-containing protein [Mycolicibacterium sp. BiH015]|uniref:VWA domain-containing protein n=1 Tax=Mycolicibacterium sp. BiH015 TaxID=3018808 RepID=UPI0022E92CA0|nr:VWA domain-containing protein [Mycolicibacterium sp. BiH015]MDA2891166.1 VWA domain-containing protein [Mycolicibacterium sp. BiH015]